MESTLQLLPKRPYHPKGNAFPKRSKFLTNHFRISIKKTNELYQYSIDTQPPIPNDSIQVFRDLVKSLRDKLVKQIGLIAHKGIVLWGLKAYEKPFILEGKKGDCHYEIIIKPTRVFREFDIQKLEGKALKQVLHVYNVVLKQKMVNIGLTEIARGRFFRLKQNIDEHKYLQNLNLQVLRTYELRLVPLMKGITLQMDTGSRVLRLQNFLQTISAAKSKQQKQQYIGSFVQCKYGNRNSYKIIKIDYSLSPLSTFYQQNSQEKMTYQRYYFQKYGIKVMELRQPLIEVILKVLRVIKQGKKEKIEMKGYLIPELVRLVGIPTYVRQNKGLMRSFDDFMHITPIKRVQHIQKMIGQINSSKGDLNIENMLEVQGYVLPNPYYYTSVQRCSEDGALNFKDRLKQPMRLEKYKWLLVYSSLSENYQQDDEDADELLSKFREVQGVLGITIQEPVYVLIQKDHIEQWKNQISKNFKNDLLVVVFLTNRESRYYGQLKRFLTNELKVASQVVLRKTLKNKGLTTFSKIICQINAKLGKALWSVPPQHPFWKNKTFAYGGISISYSKEGSTLAFVGTFSHDMTKTYSYSRTKLPLKDPVSQKMYEQLLTEWLKRYQEYQKYLPSIIILYREGLSDEQVHVKCQKQLSGLFKVIQRAQNKFTDYNPQILYIVANKRVNTRLFTDKNEVSRGKFQPKIDNPVPGSIVFQPLSTENAYDFHLAAHKVTQGTTTPTRYRIAYDASSIPQQAIAQFTYEQCYNYPNWFGSVRLPGCLQCADKLSKMVGEHIKENPVSSDLLKTPFYL